MARACCRYQKNKQDLDDQGRICCLRIWLAPVLIYVCFVAGRVRFSWHAHAAVATFACSLVCVCKILLIRIAMQRVFACSPVCVCKILFVRIAMQRVCLFFCTARATISLYVCTCWLIFYWFRCVRACVCVASFCINFVTIGSLVPTLDFGRIVCYLIPFILWN